MTVGPSATHTASDRVHQFGPSLAGRSLTSSFAKWEERDAVP